MIISIHTHLYPAADERLSLQCLEHDVDDVSGDGGRTLEEVGLGQPACEVSQGIRHVTCLQRLI